MVTYVYNCTVLTTSNHLFPTTYHAASIIHSQLTAYHAQPSHRYITDRFLPDKAIDLVDEAAAKLNNEVSSDTPNTTRSLAFSLTPNPTIYLTPAY